MHIRHKRSPGSNRAALPLFMLLLAAMPASSPVPDRAALSDSELTRARGSGFWTDPCTQDGFAVGAGGMLCGAAFSPGGCVTAFVGLMKAIYVDQCFS